MPKRNQEINNPFKCAIPLFRIPQIEARLSEFIAALQWNPD